MQQILKEIDSLRILLDENLDDRLVPVLQGFGHDVRHIRETGLRGTDDIRLVEIAKGFDVFITFDLHRQEEEWLAVNRGLIEGGVKVVRIRLPKAKPDLFMDTVRSLIFRMESWTARIQADACLITITQLGTIERARTRDEILAMLERRQTDI